MVKDALRIAELEKLLAERTAETIQMSEQLSVINSVQEALVKEMDLQAIYDLVGNRIQELFDAQVVGISTFEHEDGTEKFQYIVEKGERFYPEPRPLGKLRLHLIETRKKIIINNREEGITWFGTEVIPGTEPIKSAVFVPLITGDKITSYVTLQNIDKENAFSESEIRLLETLANSMSTALENARLLKETEQRTAELAVINSVQDALAKEMDIQAIYDLVGNRIRDLFDAQVVGIATFDYKNETEHIHYLIEKGERYYPVPRPLNTLRKHLIQTKEKILINKNFEAVTAAFGLKNIPGTEPPKSAVYVPMMVGEKVTGNISLQNVDRENAISDSDVRLLETLANSMSVALENARLFDETTRLLKETEQQKAELGVINSVQGGLAKELNMQAIYDMVGDRIRELFNAQAVMIVTFDHDTATEHFKYLIEDGQRFYLASRPYDRLRQHLIMTKQKIVINTNYAEAYAQFGLKTLPGTNPTKSGVFVPLIIGDKVNSYISLQNMKIENAFSDSDIRLLETLANSMSVALENARLFDETNRLLKETEQRTAELAVINSVQGGLARELDMQAIYDLVGNKIRDVFDAQAVIIATFDHEAGTEKFNYMIEKGERYNAEPRRYDKLRYQLIMTKQKILINSNTEEAFAEFGLKVVSGTGMPKSFLFVPLIVGNKVTSYVSLQNVDRENAFSDSDVRLLETLANSMSVALENARLFDETNRLLKETEQGKAELAVINSVQAGLVKEMDIQGIYNLVGDRIQKLFNAQVVIIATFESERRMEYFNYYFEKGETSHPDPRRFDKVRQHLIDTGQNILINEEVLKAVAEFGLRVVPGTEMPKSLLFMPLKVGDKVTGYVSLQNIDKENAFSFSDVRLLSTLANSMSVALENARLFDETNRLLKITEQGKAELGVINSVQESLVAQMGMHEIYELVGEKIREIFGAQVIDIVTYDSETDMMEDRYAYEKGDRTLVGSWKPAGFRRRVIDTGQMLVINEDLARISERYNSKVLHGEQPKSALFVPMLSGGKITGMVSLQNLDRENAFPQSSVSLLTTLSNSMSVALESARHFDETNRLLKLTEDRAAELAVINSVQAALAAQINIQGIYDVVGNKIREIFDAQMVDIVTCDSASAMIYPRYVIERGERFYEEPRPLVGFRKYVIETRQPLLVNEDIITANAKFGNPGVIQGESPKSVLFVPMIVGGEAKGVISLQNLDHENAFNQSNVNLLTTLANSMSVALESARLFDETTRLLKETEQRNAELAVINSVQESLVAQMDMQGIYELVGEKMREIFNAQVIDIFTYDKKANLIEDHYSFEKGDRTLVGSREPYGFRKHVIQTKQLLLHNENVEQSMKDFNNPILIGEMPKSQIYVPMMAGGDVTGIISLQNLDHEHAFSDSDVNLITTLANSMSVALESARLFDETNRLLKETEQRNAELAVINSVQESLVAQMDMQSIYELVGEKIREIFGAQVIDIVLYDKKENLIEDRYAYEKGDRTVLGPREPKGFRKHVIQTKQLLLHNENVEQAMQDFDNVILIGEKPKSQIYVPMMAAGEVNGIISLQNLDHEHAFSDSDVNLITTLANSMSVALESARLFDETNRLLKETEQRTAELSVINSVQEGLAKELNIQGIYELVGEKMRQIFSAQVIDIVTYDSTTNLMEDRYSFEKGDRTLAGTWKPEGFRKAVIESGQLILINEGLDKKSLEYNSKVLQGEQPKSAVFVPLISGNEVKGMISLQNLDKEHAFSDSDVNLLTTLANSMTVALESARLFDETNRLLKETEQRTAELSVINSVQEGLAKELDIQGIYELVGEKMREIFNAQVIDIVTYDKTNKTIEDRYTYEKGDRTLLGPRPLKGFRKHVIETAKALVINKDLHRQRSKFDQSVIVGKGAKSIVLVPMIASGEITGVISLQNLDQENAFSDSDVNLLSTLSNSMSVALESARLFDETNRLLKETEQRTAELAVINSVQEGLAKELDMQGIYDLIGDRVQKLFNAQSVIIATLDLDNKLEHFNYAVENGIKYNHESRPINKLRKILIEKRHSIYIPTEEIAEKEYGLSAIPGTKMSKSLLFVPLLTGNIIRGYVSLQNVDIENAFSDSDIRLLETLANSMSVALENARLFDETNRLLKETEQRTAELAVINSVQEGLAKELDMNGIYNLVGDRVQKLFNAQVVIIAGFDLDNKTEQFNYFFENNEKVKADSRPINKLRQLLIDKKHTIYIETEEKARTEYGITAIGGTQMTKSLLFVPLLTGNIIRGYVSLQNIDTENAFSDSDIRLLETLANSMSVALENARLFDETNRLLKETEQRTAELGIINSVQEGLASKLDIQAVYDLVGDKIRDVFDTQGISISFYDRKKNFITHPYYLFKGKRIEQLGFELGKGLTSHIIQTAQPLLINEKAPERFKELGAVFASSETENTTKSWLGVPLISSGQVNGTIRLENYEREFAYSESDVSLLQTLANSMSVALENARLFDETNRLLKETEQRTAELAVINSVQEGLARELDMHAIYNLVGDRLCSLFPDTQTLVIRTFDYDTGLEHFQYAIEKGVRLEVSSQPFMWASKQLILTKKSVDIKKDYVETAKKYGGTGVTKGQPPKSAVFVPMIVGDVVKGSISLQNVDTENAFNESDLRLLTTLTNSMSVALENARLFDETNRLLKETEQRTGELAVINSVQDGLAKELDMQGIFDLVGNRVQKLFNAQAVIIATLDIDKMIEHFNYAFENNEIVKLESRPITKLRQILIDKKHSIYISTEEQARKEYEITAVAGTQMPKSLLFVPLLTGNIIRGYVSLQNIDIENAFSVSDIRLLETLASSMSVALENARLFDETNRLLKETEQRTGELAVINSVQEGLVREMDMQAIYDLVGKRICELFDTQTVLIRTFDHDTGNEHWRFVIEKGERLYSKPRPFMWANQQLIKTKQPLLINEHYVETSKKYGGTGVSKGQPPKSAMFVPMVVGEVVRGSVSLQNIDRENAFTESDLRLLTTLTNSMSVALENARLFDETTLLLAEAKQRASELSTVNSISKALASQLDADDLIKLVGDQIKNLFKANIVYLALLNQKTKIIHFPYQFGDEMLPLKLGEGLTSKIIISGEPLLINKNIKELRAQLGVKQVGLAASSYLGVPIPVGDEIIGVLSVQSTEHENNFNESDQRLLSTIGASVGVALRNATLFEDVKLAKMEAEAASKVAEKANEAKSAFLSTVSHELRTPLTSVLGFAKIIRKRLDEKIFPIVDKKDPKTEKTISQISENLHVVISEGERLTHLINDVLDLAKIEAGKMEWNQENVSMPEVAERAIAATTSLFDQKALKLIKKIDTDLPEITGDKDKLIQVIINLISNSVKFTDKGSVTCRVYQEKDELMVSISDTGIGIAPQDFGAVFEQFKQVGGDTLTDKPKGTGLGLPICKEIVEHHGGRIWLESVVGKGSIFSFALPINKTTVAERPMHLNDLVKQLKEHVAQSQLNILGKASNILIVDDDDSIRSLLHQELGDAGYSIEEASNGKEALASVRKQRPDLIILDIMMPEMNGFDVAAVLKNDPETMDIPIIVLSVVQDKTRGFRIGVDRYLTKPIDTGILFNEIGSLLEQGKSKKKVMVVDQDSATVNTLTDVLKTKGYSVMEANEKELVEKAVANQPDIIIINSVLSGKQDIVQTLRFEKGLENVLFLVYQ